ncbi:hypothetical protein [Phaeobacter italicus]|uniref:hypothetical protein n=1 Tax=Phaeobacter italicus TaxID=481446 RepID=UPI00242C9575|nr:hypothetical protein [Phaeobacter italicus]MCI5102122.1 hypothetical protein [Phaeobacter italicus]
MVLALYSSCGGEFALAASKAKRLRGFRFKEYGALSNFDEVHTPALELASMRRNLAWPIAYHVSL